MDGKYITGICTVFVAVLMVGGLLMPIIDHTTEGEPVINPDAGWIRMNYDTAASAYTINISASDDGITVSNGTDTQTGDDETIYYADSNLAVWLEDGYFTVLGQSTNGPVFFQSEDDITITRDSEGVSVTDGTNTVSVGAPTWAYVPYSSGSYGFFADGVAASTNNKPTVAVGGGFAGVYAYNDITRYDGLGLKLQTTTEGGKITGAYWAKPSAEELAEPLNPGSITPINPGLINGGDVDLQPFDPITIDTEPDVSIMSVPTPTYTDGVWGYDLTTVDGVQKAVIVSYSGAGGNIVVPATVGGYDVYQFGKKGVGSSTSSQVFDESTLPSGSTLAFDKNPNLKVIGSGACSNVNKFTGSLILPDNLTNIVQYAFFNAGFNGILVIPGSDVTFGTSAFKQDTFTTIVVCSENSPWSDTFQMSTITECLDLSDTVDYAQISLGSRPGGIPTTATVETSIGDSIGYLGAAFIPGESDLSPSAVALMYIIPALILVSLIIFSAIVFVRRDY